LWRWLNLVVSPKFPLCFPPEADPPMADNGLVTPHRINVYRLSLARLVSRILRDSRNSMLEILVLSIIQLRAPSLQPRYEHRNRFRHRRICLWQKTSFVTVRRVWLSYLISRHRIRANIKTMTLPYPNLGDTCGLNPRLFCWGWVPLPSHIYGRGWGHPRPTRKILST